MAHVFPFLPVVLVVLLVVAALAMARMVQTQRYHNTVAGVCLLFAVGATLMLWNREAITASCLDDSASLEDAQVCIDRFLVAFPHRFERVKPALFHAADQVCTSQQEEEWLLARLSSVADGPEEARAEVAVEVLKHVCQNHPPCCTKVLRQAKARTWGAAVQRELDYWNNTFPWQTE